MLEGLKKKSENPRLGITVQAGPGGNLQIFMHFLLLIRGSSSTVNGFQHGENIRCFILHCIQGIYFISSCIPENHDLLFVLQNRSF